MPRIMYRKDPLSIILQLHTEILKANRDYGPDLRRS